MNIVWQDELQEERDPVAFAIVTAKAIIGAVRKLPSGEWVWTTMLHRRGRARYPNYSAALNAARRALGNVSFQERI